MPARKKEVKPKPVPVPVPEPMPVPEPVITPEPVPAPAPEPVPEVKPVPVPEPEPVPAQNTEIVDKFINTVFAEVKNKVKDLDAVNAMSLIKLTTDVIFIVQQETSKYPKFLEILTGADKKNVVLIVIKMIIKESPAQEQEKLFMISLLDTVVSPTIDILIKVSKKEIDLGKNESVNTGCCFPFLGF